MDTFLETSKYWRQSLLLLLCAVLLSAPAQADPSGRIGRIAWLSGTVQLHTANPQQSENAELNRPLTSGDILSTSAGARAEIHIGSLKLRLDSSSVLELVQVDDERIRLHLTDGNLIARLPSQESAREFELDTRDGQFTALGAGQYRFDFDGASSSATAYSGTLHFEAEDSALDIPSGQRAQFWNDGGTRYRLSTPARDDFVSWSATRDQHQTNSAYTRHVSPEMTGADDLDAYGNWSETSEYGSIWYPRTVAADWAPYRHGRWVWIAPWGWNWVGDEPWGFAPFHYGRWVWYRHAWGWVPGSRIARPVYAPALVAWIGTPNFNITISSGASPTVGWFPLAPREVYIPAYRSSPAYVRQVNITHVSHITNLTTIVNNPQQAVERAHYANRQLPQAVTVVPSDVLQRHRPVAAAALPHNKYGQQQLRADSLVAAPAARLQPATPERAVTQNRQERQDDGREERERRTTASPREPQARQTPSATAVAAPLPSAAEAGRPPAVARPAPKKAAESVPERHASPRSEIPAAQPRPDRRIERDESVTAAVQHSPARAAAEVRAPAAPVAENRQAQHSERARPESVQPPAQARQERPQRREEQREAPRQVQQELRQQAPRENSRPPERNADSRKEQREARHPSSRDEKNQQDTGRPPDEARRH